MGLVEPASSLTDFLLGIIAIGAALALPGKGQTQLSWRCTFASIGIAAVMGGVHHGFLEPYETIARASWSAISLVVAIGLSFLLAATVATVLGEGKGRVLLAVRTASLVASLVLAILGRATIATLLITEGLVMVMVVLLWVHAWRLGFPRVGLVLAAIGTSMLAGVVRGSSLHLVFAGWVFDPNALYHLAQIPGVVLLYVAVRQREQALERGAAKQPPCQAMSNLPSKYS
jgi:hypothetical protein